MASLSLDPKSRAPRRLAVLDPWYGPRGGVSKLALYRSLSRHFDLRFIFPGLPLPDRMFNVMSSFHPSVRQWKKRKNSRNHHVRKYPRTFKAMTQRYSQALERLGGDYDAILQIGSLLGPVHNPDRKPYYSYHDTTVHSVEAMWRPWLPDDFNRVRESFFQLERHLFKSMTHLFAYSRFAADSLTRFYQVPARKISVIGSSLKMTEKAVSGRGNSARELLFVSSDFRRKGGWLLMPIMKRVLSVFPDTIMTVVGRVPPSWRTEMPPQFRSTGPLPREEVGRIYRRTSLLVHPALFDPFPSVLLEAANFSVPAVASRVCAVPEIVRDGKTGYLANPGRADEFARRIVSLLRDPGRLTAMGDEARSYVHETFHPDVVAGKMAAAITTHLDR